MAASGATLALPQDLTQGFFVQLLEKEYLQQVQRARGKFRSFLLASLKHYIINEWDRGRAAKRGGGRKHLRVDFEAGESRYRLEPAGGKTPESIYEKQWALALLDRVKEALRGEFRGAGKEDHFDRLSACLTGETRSVSYPENPANHNDYTPPGWGVGGFNDQNEMAADG